MNRDGIHSLFRRILWHEILDQDSLSIRIHDSVFADSCAVVFAAFDRHILEYCRRRENFEDKVRRFVAAVPFHEVRQVDNENIRLHGSFPVIVQYHVIRSNQCKVSFVVFKNCVGQLLMQFPDDDLGGTEMLCRRILCRPVLCEGHRKPIPEVDDIRTLVGPIRARLGILTGFAISSRKLVNQAGVFSAKGSSVILEVSGRNSLIFRISCYKYTVKGAYRGMEGGLWNPAQHFLCSPCRYTGKPSQF